MRPLRFAATIALLTLPTLASAQFGGTGGMGGMGGRGGGMGGGGMRGGAGGGQRAPEFVQAKDLEKLNVAETFLDEAKKLHLSDAEKERLTTLRTTLAARNADLIARYDSVRKDFKPPRMGGGGMRGGFGGGMGGRGESDQEVVARDSAMMQMRTMTDLTEELLARRERDVYEALDLIHEAARRDARDKIDETARKIREKLPRARMERGGARGGDRDAPPPV